MIEEFQRRIKENLREYYLIELGLPDWERRVEKRIDEDLTIFPERIKRLESYVGSFEGKRILSIGSGWGGFVVAAGKAGANAVGIEPNREEIAISKLRAKVRDVECDFMAGVGEHLPFKDNSFDFVECVTVLEHVKEPKKVIEEMIRVVKKSGHIYILIPNYYYPLEQHYKIYWIPMFPKPLAKIYLKLRGKPSNFIDSINYITASKLMIILKRYDVDINEVTPPVHYQITKGKPLKRNFRSIFGIIFDVFGVKPITEILIKKAIGINGNNKEV